jgi:hypothetical protein
MRPAPARPARRALGRRWRAVLAPAWRYRPARWATALALVPLLALASVLGGAPYVYCRALARTQLHCCCHPNAAAAERSHPPRTDDTRGGPAVDSPCCVGHRVASLPSGNAPTLDAPVAVLSAPLVAVIPIALLYGGAPDALAARAWWSGSAPRAGPAPPLFALHQRYLN